MSITVELKQVTLEELERIKSDPAYFERILSEPASNQAEALKDLYLSQGITSMPELLEKFPHMKQSGEEILAQMEKILFGENDQKGGMPAISLDKSWHMIHFLLSGEVWSGETPLGSVLMGGAEIGDESFNTGYGVPRFHSPAEVKRIAEILPALEQLKENFAPEKFVAADIYAFNPDNADEEWEYLSHFYRQLFDYFHDAARRENGMLLISC